MKRSLICVMLLLGSLAFSQSDEVLDRLYEDENAKTLETALIVLQAANILTEESGVEDANAFLLEEAGWGTRVLDDGEYISTGSFSLLVMKTFDLKSGLMYKLFPSRRYALKELIFQGYILGSPYPGDTMSSFNVIYAVSSLPTNENINADYKYDTIEVEPVESATEKIVEVDTDSEAIAETIVEGDTEPESAVETIVEADTEAEAEPEDTSEVEAGEEVTTP